MLWRLYHDGAEDNLVPRSWYCAQLKKYGEHIFFEVAHTPPFEGFPEPDVIVSDKKYYMYPFYGRLSIDGQMNQSENAARESFLAVYEEHYCPVYVEGLHGVLFDVYLQGVPLDFRVGGRGLRVP